MPKRLLYLQYTNPAGYPPLEHSARLLADAGWRVRFLGTGALGGADQLRLPPHPNLEVRQWQFCPPGPRQKLHFLAFGLWALGTVLAWRPRWVYASDALACPAALALSFLPGVQVLYHEHDSPTDGQALKPETRNAERAAANAETRKAETLKMETRQRKAAGGGRRTDFSFQLSKFQRFSVSAFQRFSVSAFQRFSVSAFQRFVLWCRKRLARRAALCVLPNERRVAVFQETTGTPRPVLCVWNCPERREADLVAGERNGKALRLFFHGSIVPPRLPLAVVAAMRRAGGPIELTVAGYETTGSPGYARRLAAEAAAAGGASGFVYLGAMSRAPLLSACRQADVGLAFMPLQTEDLNASAMTGASNKPFDYLACGLALLVSARPDWEAMFVQPGYGRACDPEDPESIAAALRWFAAHPAETRAMGERGRQRILGEWNYETQFAPVRAALEGSAKAEKLRN